MSNTNKKNHKQNQPKPQATPAATPKVEPTVPTNRFNPPPEKKPEVTEDGLSLLSNLKEALDAGNINKDEFEGFVKKLGYGDKESTIDSGSYETDIISMMKQYENLLPVRALLERDVLVKRQSRLWGIINTCVNKSDYDLFKEGYRTILNRFKSGENYTVQYLFRGLANPVDPAPIFEAYTIPLYNLMLITSRKGIKATSGSVDLDKITAEMPQVVRNNLIQFYSLR